MAITEERILTGLTITTGEVAGDTAYSSKKNLKYTKEKYKINIQATPNYFTRLKTINKYIYINVQLEI